jgi:hypothetical protein
MPFFCYAPRTYIHIFVTNEQAYSFSAQPLLLLHLLDPLLPQQRALPRHKPIHQSLVLPVFRILPRGDLLGQCRAQLKEQHVQRTTNRGPIKHGISDEAGPLINHDPESLLAEKIGMPAEPPQPTHHETPLQVLPGEALQHLLSATFQVAAFRALVAPLLLIGQGFQRQQGGEKAGDNGIHGGPGGSGGGEGGGEREDVGGGGDEEQQEVLEHGDHDEVEDPERQEARVQAVPADHLPPVVLRPHVVAAFASVVVG